ncbi:CBS / octicosapeptide/Phox/Bemp1 (PB1) domains-containing protein [Klebsormidium nitens]|uniref:CBS / octicosapeptide/Phox/Bemp1 (PB1) domains-containing protein n=1 Tax=Klebsormidium nitens TaxID=105231 RepID=A0A1Y1IAB7_KLENI|nr:CBS / octicosapeptide/Phox/Bemp1 (PB1) domains-containing protein [Klebsormidium nitens]|eukprot:GAQ87513.1 CBS / octicosapeptide/Phox/Bemp1 (PB1) domains-containing protein [Klebsormidium nitens]
MDPYAAGNYERGGPSRKTSGASSRRKTSQSVGPKSPVPGPRSMGDRTVKRLRLSKALTVSVSHNVTTVCQSMSARRVDAALLTDSSASLCGIITDKDIATRVIAEGLNPDETLVSDVMTRQPRFVEAESSAVKALQIMVTGKFRHLPVVENNEVIALLDITKCLYDAIARMERAVEKGTELAQFAEDRWGKDADLSSYLKVAESMLQPTLAQVIKGSKVALVLPSDSVLDATRRMRDLKVHAVIVATEGRPLGILTSKDILMRVVAVGLKPDETPVADVMTKKPETTSLETTIVDALHIMHDGRFLHLPVVDKSGGCVGCVDVLMLTQGAVNQVSKAENESPFMLQRFFEAAADGRDEDADNTSVQSSEMVASERYPGPGGPALQTVFTFKVEDNLGRKHRFSCGCQSMAELVVALSSRLDLPPAAIPPISYIDDEGDRVLLSGDGDLSSAVNVARTAGLKNLRLYLEFARGSQKGQPKNVSQATSSWSSTNTLLLATTVAALGVAAAIYLRSERSRGS